MGGMQQSGAAMAHLGDAMAKIRAHALESIKDLPEEQRKIQEAAINKRLGGAAGMVGMGAAEVEVTYDAMNKTEVPSSEVGMVSHVFRRAPDLHRVDRLTSRPAHRPLVRPGSCTMSTSPVSR